MKRTIALLLAALLVLSMAGCGPKTDAEKLVGSWAYERDRSGVFVSFAQETLRMKLEVSPVVYTEIHTFTKDGVYTKTVDEESYAAAMEKLRGELKTAAEAWVAESVKKFAENYYDMTLEELLSVAGASTPLEFYEDSMGISVTSAIDNLIETYLGDGVLDIITEEGTYTVEESTLRITVDGTESEERIEFPDKKTLILYGSEDGQSDLYPMTLTRTR